MNFPNLFPISSKFRRYLEVLHWTEVAVLIGDLIQINQSSRWNEIDFNSFDYRLNRVNILIIQYKT